MKRLLYHGFKHLSLRQSGVLLLLFIFAAGCGKSGKLGADKDAASETSAVADPSQSGSQTGLQIGDPAEQAKAAIPPEIQAVANTVLGSSAEVLAFGDLAHNGHEQALVVNRLVSMPGAARANAASEGDGVPFTRAVVIERDGKRWIQVLRCDEHLTNPKGFLAGAPLYPVIGWRFEPDENRTDKRDAKKDGPVRTLYFAPLRAQDGSRATIAVGWNSKVNRYQVVDPTSQQFLGELESLETPASPLR